MDQRSNYWTRQRVGRRSMVRGAGLASVGLAGAALIGCGGDEDGDGGGDECFHGGCPGAFVCVRSVAFRIYMPTGKHKTTIGELHHNFGH